MFCIILLCELWYLLIYDIFIVKNYSQKGRSTPKAYYSIINNSTTKHRTLNKGY